MEINKAVDLLDNLIGMVDDNQGNDYDTAFHMAIDALKAQENKQLDSDSCDTISRAAGINAHCELCGDRGACNCDICPDVEVFRLIPSQPETHEERTETHECDCISRQAAIDAILAVTGNSSVRELYEHVQEHGLSDMWSGGVNAAIDIIIAVPSAQPERTGQWIIRDNPGTGWYRITCSECGEDVTTTAPCIGFFPNAKVNWDYCPNCGADMRED